MQNGGFGEIVERTIRKCADCGKPFHGSRDFFYCEECLKKRSSVIRERTCIDCGKTFPGGPRARRCPECAEKRRKEYHQQYKKMKPVRHLGDIDTCQMCGKEYVVKGGKQKYCDNCKEKALLEWQREQKKGYNKASGQDVKKKERRRSAIKICAYCGREFESHTTTNVCSDYCRTEQKKITMCKTDIRRDRNRNLDEYLDAREEYRNKVRKERN